MASTIITCRTWIVIVALIAAAACNDTSTLQTPGSEPEVDTVGVQSQDSIPDDEVREAGCGVSSETDLTGDGIGDLTIGTSADELADRCHVLRDTVEVRAEGHPQRVIAIDLGRTTVEAEIVDDAVWRLTVDSPAFLTSDSLGVGTPLERLLEFEDARAISGEGDLFVQVPEHCGLSFRLSEPVSALPPGDRDRANLQQLPEGTQVDRVLVVGCSN